MIQFTEFKGRNRELALLDDLWQSVSATMLILYGRRRVGKTRLLRQWQEVNSARVLYFD